jgi:microcystin degradation protein MlrC
MRIAFGRINQETNALSPVQTTITDFRRDHWLEGRSLLAACTKGGTEAEGFLKRAELAGFVGGARRAGIEPVPLTSAWTVPSGPLERSCFEELVASLTQGLHAAGEVDGVYLALHGAMGVNGVEDPEGEILAAVREAAGPVPIVASYDLHGNLTPARVRGADVTLAYHTNPHRDHVRVGEKAASLLGRLVTGAIRPTTAWRSLPMLLGGGNTIDFLAPMRGIFARMRSMERDRRVLATAAFTVHPWNSYKELGFSTCVATDGDQALAEAYADELAERLWAVRDRLPPKFPSAEEAIDRARGARLARKLGAVVMSDASDVVSAGAPGENTRLISALLERAGGMLSYAAIRDPVIVESLWSEPEGTRQVVTLGGRLDPARNSSITLEATIFKKREMHGHGRTVTLATGDLRLVVTEGPALVVKPAFYSGAGLDLWKADIMVVKNFFPFLLYFLPVMRKTIFVQTKGVTDFDAAYGLDFAGPLHPRDRVEEWRSTDRRRRPDHGSAITTP